MVVATISKTRPAASSLGYGGWSIGRTLVCGYSKNKNKNKK